jgi:DNA-binding transcriptional regulator YiaG
VFFAAVCAHAQVEEEKRIAMRLRPLSALEQVRRTSDLEATDVEAMRAALALSRKEFATRSSLPLSSSLDEAHLKQALSLSLNEFDKLQV